MQNVTLENRTPVASDGWIYLGRGTKMENGSVPVLNFSSNIVGTKGETKVPSIGSVTTLKGSVSLGCLGLIVIFVIMIIAV